MLVDLPNRIRPDPYLAALAALRGRRTAYERIQTGVYLRGDYGNWPWHPGYDEYPEFNDDLAEDFRGPYGVCDVYTQVLEHYPELSDDCPRQFVLMLTEVRAADQEPNGGWRWHKWGEYIGTKDPQCEYLYDERGIDRVYCFHIYEREAGVL